MIPFAQPPAPSELPERFPSPFDRAAIHPLARRAAKETQLLLTSPTTAAWQLALPGNGKMFGVLVVQASNGYVGYLRAFSGMLAGQWEVDGWAPPVFDRVARDAVWIAGEAELLALSSQRRTLEGDPSSQATVARDQIDAARTARSRDLLPRIQQTYRFPDARGCVRSLHEIFAPHAPPAGAGDCAAPKLLAHAYALDLRPLALAEWWWGAPPRTGDRHTGSFYPACHGKCGPILAHMLGGLPVDPPPLYGAGMIPSHEPRVVYEDAHIVIVDKPSGLLSVPGRSGLLRDSVATRLRERYPDATGSLVTHRLDLDTSGLLLAAKDADTSAALQRLFSLRQITKRYVAWVEGDFAGEEGVIDLSLRPDPDDRPRQMHDPERGKAAITEWRVLARAGGRTRVALTPRTGRTHQLRVHAAHPLGLDAPIVGDRLYARHAPDTDERLLLHAELLAFMHPVTGEPVQVERAAPF